MAKKTLNRKNKRTRTRTRRHRTTTRRHSIGGASLGAPCSPNSTISRPNVSYVNGQYKCCNGKWTSFNGMNKGC